MRWSRGGAAVALAAVLAALAAPCLGASTNSLYEIVSMNGVTVDQSGNYIAANTLLSDVNGSANTGISINKNTGVKPLAGYVGVRVKQQPSSTYAVTCTSSDPSNSAAAAVVTATTATVPSGTAVGTVLNLTLQVADLSSVTAGATQTLTCQDAGATNLHTLGLTVQAAGTETFSVRNKTAAVQGGGVSVLNLGTSLGTTAATSLGTKESAPQASVPVLTVQSAVTASPSATVKCVSGDPTTFPITSSPAAMTSAGSDYAASTLTGSVGTVTADTTVVVSCYIAAAGGPSRPATSCRSTWSSLTGATPCFRWWRGWGRPRPT